MAKEAKNPFERLKDGDDRPEVLELVRNLKKALPELEKLLEQVNDHWVYEDGVYRFYHQSYKVFGRFQGTIKSIVEKLESLRPGKSLNKWFMEVVKDGTKEEFDMSMNKAWTKHTRPVVEAFFHAKFFLEMAVKYAKEFKDEELAPSWLPSGWAAFLYLYDLR